MWVAVLWHALWLTMIKQLSAKQVKCGEGSSTTTWKSRKSSSSVLPSKLIKACRPNIPSIGRFLWCWYGRCLKGFYRIVSKPHLPVMPAWGESWVALLLLASAHVHCWHCTAYVSIEQGKGYGSSGGIARSVESHAKSLGRSTSDMSNLADENVEKAELLFPKQNVKPRRKSG